ncbi:hypothetical protein [Candidatus Berkiella aquae]|uniref:Uncharacterized protein n=1 Tax=Candidatus Berkiella aquae TaxID=295108 RepID=A0A0Q9YSI5_9GAMM|nr:hypothetical protein [Candidatus Berkiella aquae]MCS5711651.1 hypothetical protein [Candidatus Berkiella aquae]
MDILDQDLLSMVSAGNAIFIAIGAGVSTYVGTATIINATQTLNQFGHALGEQIFNATQPDQLGQMVYPANIVIENSASK